DTGPQQMPDVRAHRVDLALLAVERDRVVAAGIDPVVAVEALAQGRGLVFQSIGEGRVVPDLTCEPGGPDACVVGVTLDLAGGDRSFCHSAVGEEAGVPRILPALVDQAFLRTGLIPQVCVPVAVP